MPPSFCLAFFFIYLSPCSVSSLSSQMCRASCPFQGRSLACCCFFATPSPSQFLRLLLFISLLLSLVMSLSRCESLGYQCSASDRKRMINKLSCFSSPLYPPPFFFWNEDSCCSQRHFSSSPPSSSTSSLPSLLFPLLSWMAGSHRCVTIITRTLRKKNNVVSSI